MKRNFYILFFLILFVYSSLQLKAQVQNDLQLWTNLSVSKKVKDFKFSVEEEFRFYQNISSIEHFYTDFGVTYKINKHFDLGLNYRLRFNHTYIEQYQNSHRFNVDAKYKFDFDRFDCYYRIRYQSEVESFLYVPSNDFFDNAVRNKLKFSYDIDGSKLEPFAEIEFFTDVSNLNNVELYKMRYTLGLGSEKNKFKGFEAFYRLEQTFGKNVNKNDFVIGLSYAFEL